MELNLTRPIAFLDLETTGVNVAKDRIVEIAVVKIMPDGNVHEKQSRVRQRSTAARVSRARELLDGAPRSRRASHLGGLLGRPRATSAPSQIERPGGGCGHSGTRGRAGDR